MSATSLFPPSCASPAPWAEPARRALAAGLGLILLLAVSPAIGADSLPPAVTAEAGLLLDLDTGRVLYAKNPESDRAPASLVKLMTLYLAYEDLHAGRAHLGDPVIVSPNAARTPAFRMGLIHGQVVPFDVLLAGVAIASANDAATAVAEHVAGTEEAFVGRMNATAERMSLSQTIFANPHGLPDPTQRTTARDMAALAERLLLDFPESRELLGESEFAWRGRVYRRRVPLFRDPGGVTALKTGYTIEAGFNLAVAAGKAGHRVLAVILGAETRGLSFLDARRLLKFGFGEPVPEPRADMRRWRGRLPTTRTGSSR